MEYLMLLVQESAFFSATDAQIMALGNDPGSWAGESGVVVLLGLGSGISEVKLGHSSCVVANGLAGHDANLPSCLEPKRPHRCRGALG